MLLELACFDLGSYAEVARCIWSCCQVVEAAFSQRLPGLYRTFRNPRQRVCLYSHQMASTFHPGSDCPGHPARQEYETKVVMQQRQASQGHYQLGSPAILQVRGRRGASRLVVLN